jgi:hypothetical protein
MLSPAPIMRMAAATTPAHAAAAILASGFLRHGLGSGELRQEQLHFVGGSFHGEEVQHDADSHLGGRSVDADTGAETSNQLVHTAPPVPYFGRVAAIMYIRGWGDKDKRGAARNRRSGVANLTLLQLRRKFA